MDIKDLKQDHPRIYARALECQVEQGNEPNEKLELGYDCRQGNFEWSVTTEGAVFWNEIYKDNFQVFYDKYPDTNIKLTGIELIAKERQEQIEKHGFDAVNDSEYNNESLLMAAVTYALPDKERSYSLVNMEVPESWPFHDMYWKPSPNNRVKELIKAGALIAAEIDRLNAQPKS